MASLAQRAHGAAASAAAAAATARVGPPSLTLLSGPAAAGARAGRVHLLARRRDGTCLAQPDWRILGDGGGAAARWSGGVALGAAAGADAADAAADDEAAHRRRCRRRRLTGSALVAGAAGTAGTWPASSLEPEAAGASQQPQQPQRADLAASVAAAALEAAAHQAEGDATAELGGSAAAAAASPSPASSSSSSPTASFASASSASLSSVDSAASSASSSAAAAAEAEAAAAAAAAAAPSKKKGGGGGLAKRVASGVLLGAGGAVVVAAGGIPFLCAALFVTFHATREFYDLLTSRGLSKGMTPPGPVVSASTAALCMSIALLTHATRGRSGVAMAVAGFVLLSLNLLSSPKPKFAQLTSSLFGLFYCGYLPSFWIKLRAVAAPLPADAPVAALLPAWLQQHAAGGATVGLAVTLTAVACVIAADTGAYFVGKSLGRTKLTDISPKKTVEGALGGLASSVAAALALQALLTGWPAVPVAAAAAAGLHFPQAAVPWAAPLLAAAFGAAVFVSSILGDLIESIIKREAGKKDSGDLIPGHGGLLDRFDSYIFTGAVAYGFVVFGHLF